MFVWLVDDDVGVVRWLGKCLVSGLDVLLGGCFTVLSWDWVSG